MSDDNEQTTATALAELTNCPHCGENLVGDEIEPSRREWFGNRTHYSKLVGINGDSVMFYECPKCRGRVERAQGPAGDGSRTFDVEIR